MQRDRLGSVVQEIQDDRNIVRAEFHQTFESRLIRPRFSRWE
jgi:hypothetical protein